ncbi:MAG: Na/Pi cotransporter family protein [Gemmatimonadetes bacterium]|nr:Na/Pi cotransporter family protein [Gemmatimonadota bacterium]NNM05200.1 Na/Pi cotransporter family protein [Gemmatimonadota bacterium]
MGLFGGLALFLFGMDQLSKSLKSVAGGRMKALLSRLTTNRVTAAFSGALVTAVIQSSSVTTVLVVGFISAGLMTMVQSVGVIMGANIGTTVTAQIVAFKVTEYALLLVALGFGMQFFARRTRVRDQGMILMGLGLIFFGMGVMGDAMDPLRSSPFFIDLMKGMETPFWGILIGAAFTALVQSSSATTGVVIVLATQGFLSLPAGIALAFGANVGTCVTAVLAAMGKPREALRAAAVHVLFNVLGVVIWVAFIDQLADMVVAVSPAAPGLTGLDKLAAETPRQIANAHTLFNVVNTVLFLPLAGLFVKVVEWLVPELPPSELDVVRPRYLDLELIQTPSLAADRARLEVLHMGDRVRGMLTRILPALFEGTHEDLIEIKGLDEGVDLLHGRIVDYLRRLNQEHLSESVAQDLMSIMEAANDLEAVGDIIETNLVAQGLGRLEEGLVVSQVTQEVIFEFHKVILRAFDLSLQGVSQRSREAAQAAVGMKGQVNQLADMASLHEVKRLVADEPRRLEMYTLEVDVLKNLKRVYYFSKRMARGVLVATGSGE